MNLSYSSFCYGHGGLPAKILWGISIIRTDSYPVFPRDASRYVCTRQRQPALCKLSSCAHKHVCAHTCCDTYVCIHMVFNSVAIRNLDSSWALISIIFSFLVCLKKDWIAQCLGTQSRLHHPSFILIVMLIHRWGHLPLFWWIISTFPPRQLKGSKHLQHKYAIMNQYTIQKF